MGGRREEKPGGDVVEHRVPDTHIHIRYTTRATLGGVSLVQSACIFISTGKVGCQAIVFIVDIATCSQECELGPVCVGGWPG